MVAKTPAHARKVGRRIKTDTDGYPLFDCAGQCVAAATLLARQLPQPTTPEERWVQIKRAEGTVGKGSGVGSGELCGAAGLSKDGHGRFAIYQPGRPQRP